MSLVAAAIVTSAVVAAGATMYAASQTPDIPPAPPPSSYYSYDADGNPTGEQVWDASKNAYVYKAAPLTEEQKAEKAKRDELRQRMLDNLSNTPEDRIKAYQEYADTFSESMHADADEQYEKVRTASEENLAARGMLGSRAYADTMSDLNEQKIDMDTDIAQKAALAKEELANTDRQYWLNVLGYLDSNQNLETTQALQKQQTAAQGAQLGTAGAAAQYQLNSNNMMTEWQTKQNNLQNFSNNMMDTSTGLAFLYGYKGTGGAKKGTGSPLSGSAFSNVG